MSDETPYRLAYDASVSAVRDQAGVLDDLRGRAGTIFAAAALVTLFLGGLALDTDRDAEVASGLGAWSGIAVGWFVATALLTLLILRPFRFRFSLSAAEIIEIVDERSIQEPVTAIEAYRELALRLEINYDRNATSIRRLLWCFRLAIVALVAEVAVWIVVIEQEL